MRGQYERESVCERVRERVRGVGRESEKEGHKDIIVWVTGGGTTYSFLLQPIALCHVNLSQYKYSSMTWRGEREREGERGREERERGRERGGEEGRDLE